MSGAERQRLAADLSRAIAACATLKVEDDAAEFSLERVVRQIIAGHRETAARLEIAAAVGEPLPVDLERRMLDQLAALDTLEAYARGELPDLVTRARAAFARIPRLS